MDTTPTRRRLLATGLAVATAALAGCGGDSDPLAEYRSALTGGLDVEIRDLSVDGGVVHLAYDSAARTRTREWGREIGFAAGRYGAFAAEGWETSRLEATVAGTGGTTVAWHVDAETAAAHAEGDLDTGEFVSRVLSTVEER